MSTVFALLPHDLKNEVISHLTANDEAYKAVVRQLDVSFYLIKRNYQQRCWSPHQALRREVFYPIVPADMENENYDNINFCLERLGFNDMIKFTNTLVM